jgi:hypothetical protein
MKYRHFTGTLQQEANMKFHYSNGTEVLGELDAELIALHIMENPGGQHLVWSNGMTDWKDAREVSSISDLLIPQSSVPDQAPSQAPSVLPEDIQPVASKADTARSSSAPAGSYEAPTPAPRPRRRVLWLSIAGVVLVAAALAVYFVTRGDNDVEMVNSTDLREYPEKTISEESQEQGDGGVRTHSSQVPDGFKKLLRQKTLFAVDYEDLVIESTELNTGWWEISVHNGNNSRYGGDPDIMPHLGTYRYYPPTGMLQYYEVSDDTWYDWTGEGTEEFGANALSEEEDKSVRRFVLDFVRASNSNDVGALMEFYASSVDYYSWGESPKSKIRGDKEKYFKRWPVRDYSVRTADISIAVGDMGGVYYVSFVMDYSVRDPSNDRERNGKSNFEMTIVTKDDQGNMGGGLWISRERSE